MTYIQTSVCRSSTSFEIHALLNMLVPCRAPTLLGIWSVNILKGQPANSGKPRR